MSAIGILPLINQLKSTDAKQAWFVDDATAGGHLEQLHEWWVKVNNLGPTFRYFINVNPSKTWLIAWEGETPANSNTKIHENWSEHKERDTLELLMVWGPLLQATYWASWRNGLLPFRSSHPLPWPKHHAAYSSSWPSKQVDILSQHHPWNLRLTTAPWGSIQPPFHSCSDWKRLCHWCWERPLCSSYPSRWPRPYETNRNSCLWIHLFSESHCSSLHPHSLAIAWNGPWHHPKTAMCKGWNQATQTTGCNSHTVTDYTTKTPPPCNGTE